MLGEEEVKGLNINATSRQLIVRKPNLQRLKVNILPQTNRHVLLYYEQPFMPVNVG